MKIREKDHLYDRSQRIVNMVHSNLLLENADDAAKADLVLGDVMKHKCQTFLEVGTRLGLVPLYVASFGVERSVGIDLVPQFIKIAKLRSAEVSDVKEFQQPEYIIADMHVLPFEDQEFDYVCSHAALEHAHDPAKAMAEIFRVASDRIYLTIDLCNTKAGLTVQGHYSVRAKPQDWLDLVPEGFTVKHTMIADELTIEGYRK